MLCYIIRVLLSLIPIRCSFQRVVQLKISKWESAGNIHLGLLRTNEGEMIVRACVCIYVNETAMVQHSASGHKNHGGVYMNGAIYSTEIRTSSDIKRNYSD